MGLNFFKNLFSNGSEPEVTIHKEDGKVTKIVVEDDGFLFGGDTSKVLVEHFDIVKEELENLPDGKGYRRTIKEEGETN